MNHNARAASQRLKIAESFKRSSRHARDLIVLKRPADERQKTMSRRGTSTCSFNNRRATWHPHVPLHPTTLSHSTAPDRSAYACSRTCMAGAVCRTTTSRAFCGPALSIVTSPHRPINRLPNTINQKAHPRTASSTSQHEPRARAAALIWHSQPSHM